MTPIYSGKGLMMNVVALIENKSRSIVAILGLIASIVLCVSAYYSDDIEWVMAFLVVVSFVFGGLYVQLEHVEASKIIHKILVGVGILINLMLFVYLNNESFNLQKEADIAVIKSLPDEVKLILPKDKLITNKDIKIAKEKQEKLNLIKQALELNNKNP